METYEGTHVEIKEGPDKGKLREPTWYELQVSQSTFYSKKRLQEEYDRVVKELTEVNEECKHTVIYDAIGIPYHIRICAGCGISLGTV